MSAAADVLGAAAGLAGAAAAWFSIWYSRVRHRHQVVEAQRHQATLVNVVLHGRRDGQWPPIVSVHNNSDRAIYDLNATVRRTSSPGATVTGDNQPRVVL